MLTSTLSQLKYILATKSKSWEMYALIAVDSVFYLYSLTLVINDKSSLLGIIVLTLGKLLGVTLANFVEEKFIHKIYAYQFYFSDLEFVLKLEYDAHKNGISITTFEGRSNGIKRYVVNTHLNQKQEKWIFDYLKEKGIESPTADCIEIKKTFGYVKQRLQN